MRRMAPVEPSYNSTEMMQQPEEPMQYSPDIVQEYLYRGGADVVVLRDMCQYLLDIIAFGSQPSYTVHTHPWVGHDGELEPVTSELGDT